MPITRQSGLARASTGIFFLLALLLSVGVAAFSYHSVRDFERRAVWLQHSYTVLNKLEEANSTVRDAVSTSRGYALSGQQEYRSNFEAGVRHLNALLQDLRRLLSDNPVTVPMLCEAVHVSRRTLQYCFEDVLGMSPMSYLRSLRLNGVRRALCHGDGSKAPGSIGDIAAAWGFANFSQFCCDYKKLFGQTPSSMLQGRIRH